MTRGIAGSALILAGLFLALLAALAPEPAGASAGARATGTPAFIEHVR